MAEQTQQPSSRNSLMEYGNHPAGSSKHKVVTGPQPQKPSIEDHIKICEQKWESILQDKTKEKKPDMQSNGLATELSNHLDEVMKSSDDDQTTAKRAIALFLSKNKSLDRCVVWFLLSELLDRKSTPWDNEDRVSMLIKIVCGLNAELPFISICQGKTPNGCTISSHEEYFKLGKVRNSPFRNAITYGNIKAFRFMVENLKGYYSQNKHKELPFSISTLLQRRDAGPLETILQEVTKSDYDPDFEMLGILLEIPGIVSDRDTTFTDAVKNGSVRIVQKFLEVEKIQEVYVTSKFIISTLDNNQSNSLHDHTQIVISLLEKVKTRGGKNEKENVITRCLVDKIIKLDLIQAWRSIPEGCVEDPESLLHLAIAYQRPVFVKEFLQLYPRSVTREAQGPECLGKEYYPLWYNNKCRSNSTSITREPGLTTTQSEIRSAVIEATIRQVHKMKKLSEIFQGSDEKVNEICFDISLFNSRHHRVDEFVYSLVNHQASAELFFYEPILKYVRFPSLENNIESKETQLGYTRKEHKEVFDVLNWLRKEKHVSSIVELRVPDRILQPHNELRIAEYVKDFSVEILDWRFLDLSLSIFEPDVKRRITQLHLYSSGKRAAINEWLGPQGVTLEIFPKLSKLTIHLVKETMSKTCLKMAESEMKRHFQDIQENRAAGPKLEVQIKESSWNPTRERRSAIEEIAQKAFPRLYPFIESYQSLKIDRRTRVAIIDNGIMGMPYISTERKKTLDSLNDAKHSQVDQTGLVNGSIPISTAKGLSTSKDSQLARDITTGDSLNGVSDLNLGKQSSISREDRTVLYQIKDGYSFANSDSHVSPWMFASDPHGTQMANLICAIDPACELYIAKVTDERYGISWERVQRAIEWAASKDVDIISMSFTILDPPQDFKDFIDEKKWKGKGDKPDNGDKPDIGDRSGKGDIIMLCSAHDDGGKDIEAWPAKSPATITIAACDKYGVKLPGVDDDFEWKLHGQNIAVGTIPFLDSNKEVSGSSVATAIAAGLGSLILSCHRLANGCELSRRRISIISDELQKMSPKNDKKFVILDNFAHIDATFMEGEPIEAGTVIYDHFKSQKIK